MKFINNFLNNRKKMIFFAFIIVVVLVVIGLVIAQPKDKKDNEENDVLEFLYEKDNILYYSDINGKIYKYNGYKKINQFNNGVAIFLKDIDGQSCYGLIDKNGKEVVSPGKYSRIEETNVDGLFEVSENSLYGIIDSKGNKLIPIEYEDIKLLTYKTDTYIYYVKKNNKKYFMSSNGNKIVDSNDNYDSLKTNSLKKINDDYDGVVCINNIFYNARTGEKVYDNNEKIKFEYNILFDGNKIKIYNKELKVKQEINEDNLQNVQVYSLESGYIVLVETIKGEEDSYSKYIIYDSNLNQKKVVDCLNARELKIDEIGSDYFYIMENYSYSGKKIKYKTTLYDKDLKENIIEKENNQYCSVDNKGKVLFLGSDYDKREVSFYNVQGKEISKIEGHKINTKFSYNNYIALQNIGKSGYIYDIYNFNGDIISENISNIENSKSNYLILKRKDSCSSVLLENGTEIKEDGYNANLCDDKIVFYNSNEKMIKIYNNSGKCENTIKDVYELKVCNDKYLLLKDNNKYKVYNCEKDKIVFEFESSKFKNEYSSKKINIVELDDAFYTFDGKIVIKK